MACDFGKLWLQTPDTFLQNSFSKITETGAFIARSGDRLVTSSGKDILLSSCGVVKQPYMDGKE